MARPGGRKPRPANALVGELLLDRYRVKRTLGKGSFGEVFAVEHETLGKAFACKVLHSDIGSSEKHIKRFRREADTMSRVAGDHVVKVFDFGETEDGRFFYVMEFLDGEDLASALSRETRFEWQRAREVAVQILAALTVAHDAGTIHRDVKPNNCFLVRGYDGRECVKVLDFGITKLFGAASDSQTNLTEVGMIMGSPAYMAPEQALDRPLDQRTDIYGVGVLLFQLLTGELPFPGKNAIVCLTKHVKEPPPRFADVAPGVEIPILLEAVVGRALAKQPDARFQSAGEFADALRAVV